ncbi:MAG: NapC/NirT family cytochrome c [Polaromonas sp.]|nr:NapC/NirT family cytochrome c [Polaromonas sp.]
MKTIFQIVFKNWKTTLAALSALFVFSLTVGIGGAYLVGWTGKEEFCISCHNMSRILLNTRALFMTPIVQV